MDEQRQSLKQRIGSAEPVDQGWTNRVYITEEGTVIKVFSRHLIESLIFGAADTLHGKLNIPFKKERVRKEVEMKKSLEAKGYSVPDIIGEYGYALEMEKIKGESLAELMNNNEAGELYEKAEKTGELISQLHDQKISLGDATFENFYFDGEEIYTIDHEYGSLNSDFLDRERDAIHILSDALEHDREKYQAFREGFEETYRKFNRPELFLAVVFSVFTSILGLQPQRLKKTLLNTFRF